VKANPGDVLGWREPVWIRTGRKPRHELVGHREIVAEVVRVSGIGDRHDTLTLKVIEASGEGAPAIGALIIRKGADVYR
jgi:hypothetical protein